MLISIYLCNLLYPVQCMSSYIYINVYLFICFYCAITQGHIAFHSWFYLHLVIYCQFYFASFLLSYLILSLDLFDTELKSVMSTTWTDEITAGWLLVHFQQFQLLDCLTDNIHTPKLKPRHSSVCQVPELIKRFVGFKENVHHLLTSTIAAVGCFMVQMWEIAPQSTENSAASLRDNRPDLCCLLTDSKLHLVF